MTNQRKRWAIKGHGGTFYHIFYHFDIVLMTALENVQYLFRTDPIHMGRDATLALPSSL